MPNRLARETSPYLRQHADNPVDWYPWGEEAFARARAENKAVLLSVGYSACHWCHVMAHESFEDPAIAALMNRHFVNVKVDREERPDVDAVYMEAVQALTGHGGWPMTVFLTPEGKPFWGGTYFPPRDRQGMPGFPRILESLAEAYRTRHGDITQQAQDIAAELGRFSRVASAPGALGEATLAHALDDLKRRYDPQWGGFGGAPKFPPSMTLELLLRLATRQHDEAARAMLEHTLVQMARGGLYDHLGGGFHRYSVDREWLVPHFEKMLYDNALLSRIYTLAHVVTGDALYRVVACETLDYVARELTGPHGGFYATQDADSEGEEGNFFVWTLAELEEILGPEARLFAAVFGVSAHGNFEGSNVLHLARAPKEVAESEGVPLEAVQTAVANGRAALFAARAKRVAPGRDEKIVAAWNGMMLKSFAEAARALDHADYRAIAERNADFLLGTLVRDGQLSRIHKDGETKIPGFLEDYANVIDGLLALYEATLTPRWIEAALALTETMLAEFWDANEQAFYDTGKSHEALFTRPRDLFDNAVPAGNSVAIDVLLRLARLTDDARWRGVAESALASIGEYLERYPTGMGRALCALDFHLMPGQEIVLAGAPDAPAMAALRRIVFAGYHPYAIVAGGDDEAMHALEKRLPLLRERAGAPKPLVYVCSGHACLPPIETPSDLRAALALQQKR